MKLSWTRWQFIGRRDGGLTAGLGWRSATSARDHLGGFLLPDFKINLAQLLERAVGADFYRPDGTVHELGDFLVFQVLEAGQHEHFAMFQRQAGQGGAEQHYILGGRRLF